MNYTKPALRFECQANLLINRGLIADLNELTEFLTKINYYRFTGYLYPYRSSNNDNYCPGTEFELVKNIYYFDKDLRLLTLSAIETIDIAILRTQMVEKFTLSYGPFCYTEFRNYNNKLTPDIYNGILNIIDDNLSRSKETFVNAYRAKYTDETYLPFWMVTEASSTGLLSRIFQYLPINIGIQIAKQYNLHSRILESWLHSLSNVRNICAHHSRLWNRTIPVKPEMPSRKYHPEFYTPSRINNNKYFVIISILKYLLDLIQPNNSIVQDFNNLLLKYPNVPIVKMGFPNNWQDYSLFQ